MLSCMNPMPRRRMPATNCGLLSLPRQAFGASPAGCEPPLSQVTWFFVGEEAGGLQLAAQYDVEEARPKIVFFAHNVDRPRARLALKWWNIAQKVDLFLACSQTQAEFLRRFLNLPADRVRHIWDHTDTQFFSPGAVSDKPRPLIVSVGLEQRDYKTLAEATRNLDVDVRISGYSLDARAVDRAFPKPLPKNMTRRFYEWPELLQLYRDADVVVVSCFENNYAAGVQVLLEAMACKRPVIATKTSGLNGYFDDAIISIAPENAQAMQDAILSVLKDTLGAYFRADRAHSRAVQLHDTGHYVKELAKILRTLS